MDVIGCHQAGVSYTVAPLGTSLTEDHARLLKRYTDNVIVLFDPDAAGIKAALRGALILIERGLFVKVASLPDGLDPDEYILKYGKESFERILDSAQELIEFHTQLQLQSFPKPLSAQQKTTIVSVLAQTLDKQPDEIVRREWAKYVAEQVGVEEQLVLGRLRQVRQTASFAPRSAKPVVADVNPSGTHSAEEDLLAWVMKNPQYTVLCAELTAQDFSSPSLWKLLGTLVTAHTQHPEADDLTALAQDSAPEQKQEIIKLALLPVPADFEPARDIAACAAKLTAMGLQKQLKQIKQQMKTYGTGNVPPEVFQQYAAIQNKLKKYRN